MTHPHQTHICAITPADLETVKALLEIVLGETLGASHRLEVFARLAGYRTYAALKADLQTGIDIFGDPLPTPLYANPRKNDPFIAELPVEVRRKLAILEQVGLLRMLAVALRISNDPVFGNIGLDPKDLDSIFKTAMEDKAQEGVEKDRLFELPAGRLILVTSPVNLADLRARVSGGIDNGSGTPKPDDPWHLSPAHLAPNAQFFENPRPEDLVVMGVGNIDRLAALVADGTLVFFSDEDLEAFSAFVTKHTGRIVNPRNMISVKTAALEIESEMDGGFFEVGYYGTARNDIPHGEGAMTAINGDFAVQWLSEIANVVHACSYEYNRMALGTAA